MDSAPRRRFSPSPERYRRITVAALVALSAIVLTGAAVRLTGSGLGCPDWPTCYEDRFFPKMDFHGIVESVNRYITGAVAIAVILAVLGSRRRRPYRRDLLGWSLVLVAGVVAQVVLGAFVVWLELTPKSVIAHFLLSMVLVWAATVLVGRASHGGGPARRRVPAEDVSLSRLLGLATAIVLVTGTVVTGSGPHSGDDAAARLPFFVPDVARIHGIATILFLSLALVAVVRQQRRGAPPDVLVAGRQLVAVIVAQGAIGYTQYLTGVPVGLVALHIVGATLVVIAVTRYHLLLFRHDPLEQPEPADAIERDRPADQLATP